MSRKVCVCQIERERGAGNDRPGKRGSVSTETRTSSRLINLKTPECVHPESGLNGGWSQLVGWRVPSIGDNYRNNAPKEVVILATKNDRSLLFSFTSSLFSRDWNIAYLWNDCGHRRVSLSVALYRLLIYPSRVEKFRGTLRFQIEPLDKVDNVVGQFVTIRVRSGPAITKR